MSLFLRGCRLGDDISVIQDLGCGTGPYRSGLVASVLRDECGSASAFNFGLFLGGFVRHDSHAQVTNAARTLLPNTRH